MTENPNNNDFRGDDDGIFEWFDDFIEYLKKIDANQPDGVTIEIMKLDKVKEFRYVRYLMQRAVKGCDAEVTYAINEPWVGHGSVTVQGKNIIIREPRLFAEAGRYALNLDIYPKTDGTVQMDFGFQGLANVSHAEGGTPDGI